MSSSRPVLVALVALALITAGCSHRSDDDTTGTAVNTTSTTAVTTTSTTSSTPPTVDTSTIASTGTSTTSTEPPTVSTSPSTSTTTTSALPVTTTTRTGSSTTSTSTTFLHTPTTGTAGGQPTPAGAASGLLAAWQQGDRDAAADYADAAAVQSMFRIPREPVQMAGPCQRDGAAFSCPYLTKSGDLFFMRTRGSAVSGYVIAAVTSAVD